MTNNCNIKAPLTFWEIISLSSGQRKEARVRLYTVARGFLEMFLLELSHLSALLTALMSVLSALILLAVSRQLWTFRWTITRDTESKLPLPNGSMGWPLVGETFHWLFQVWGVLFRFLQAFQDRLYVPFTRRMSPCMWWAKEFVCVKMCKETAHNLWKHYISVQFSILYTEYNASMVLYLCGLDERV